MADADEQAVRDVAAAIQVRPPRGRTWYVVPDYRADGTPSISATVVDRAGQHIASFEHIEDAERAVRAVNGEE